MTLAKFYSGTSAELENKQTEEGSIYFTTDTKAIVVDIPDGERISYGDQSENFKKIEDKIDKINDFTTGINLLKGTKDFIIGSDTFKFGYYKDGFHLDAGKQTIGKGIDGFGILQSSLSSESEALSFAYSPMIKGFEAGDTLTISFYAKYQGPLTRYSSLVRIFLYGPSSTSLDNGYIKTLSINGNDLFSSSTEDEWTLYNAKFEIPDTVNIKDENVFLGILFYTSQSGSTGRYFYTQPMVQRGKVNHPIWSPSPFDVDHINDFTTGINLFRSTRDFTIGNVSSFTSFAWDNGFKQLQNGSYYKYIKDSHGFTIANISRTGLTSQSSTQLLSPVAYNFSKGDTVTVSFEFMVDDASEWDVRGDIGGIRFVDKSNTTINGIGFGKTEFPFMNNVESGKWYQCVMPITCAGSEGVEYGVYCWLGLNQNGSINFRKLCLYSGKINNPIWSASPFDLPDVGPAVNDLTTETNLLRGTRDFTLGSHAIGKYYTDGFAPYEFTITNDVEGYGVATYSDAPSPKELSPSLIPFSKGMTKITFAFDVKPITPFNASDVVIYFRRHNSSGVQQNSWTRTASALGLDTATVGEWKTVVVVFDNISTFQEGDYLSTSLYVQTGKSASYRKLEIYNGQINHPVWSMSPFDLDYINDKTTEINLLRGTRDITVGTEPASVGKYLSDGFTLISSASYFNIGKDKDDFGIIKSSDVTANVKYFLTSAYDDIQIGEIYTLYFDFMPEVGKVCGKDDLIGVINVYDTSTTSETTGRTQTINLTPSNCGMNDLVPGKWCQGKYTFTINQTNNQLAYLGAFLYVARAEYANQFKKIGMVKGKINNPIWTASPFDINDETSGINLIKDSKDLITGDRKTGYQIKQAIITKDLEGFSVVNLSNTGQTTVNPYRSFINSAYVPIELEEKYTVSFDYMVDDIEKLDSNIIGSICIYSDNENMSPVDNGGLTKRITNISIEIDKTSIESGKWYTLVKTFYPSDIKSKFFNLWLYCYQNGSFNIRKPCLYKGHINNPVWSASPFDLTTIECGGTGANNRKTAFENLAFLGQNPTGGVDNDTREKWQTLGTGLAYINGNNQLVSQPAQWGYLINFAIGNEIHQEFWQQSNGPHWRRGGNGSTTTMPGWTQMLDTTNYTQLVPTKTGSGASGTWGISITGNAATATTAGNVTGTVAITNGGTGKTNAAEAWTALGGGSVGKLNTNASSTQFLRGDGTWQVPPNTTYSVFKGATATTAGTIGLVPAPPAG